MNKIATFFICYFLFFPVKFHSQNNADSLRKEWNNTSRPDSARMKALDLLIRNVYLKINPDSGTILAKQLYDYAVKVNDADFKAQSIHLQAHCAYRSNRHSDAIDLFKKSIAMRKKTGNKKGLASSMSNVATVLQIIGNNLEAIDYGKKGVALWKETGDKEGLMKALNTMGNIYNNTGQYVEAIDHYYQATKICEELKNDNMLGQLTVNTGNVFYMKRDFSKAVSCYLKGAQLLEKTGDKRNLANAISNIGTIYLDRKIYDSAEVFLKKGLAIRKEVNDLVAVSMSLSNLSKLYLEKNDYDMARTYILGSIEICKKTGKLNSLATNLINLGSIYEKQKNYGEAKKLAIEALGYSKESGDFRNILACYEGLYGIDKIQGNYKEALMWHEKYRTTSDSLLNDENQKTFLKSQYKFEYEKKATADSLKTEEEKKITTLKLEKEKTQRYALYGGVILLLLFGLFMINRFKVSQKQKQLIEKQKQEVENQKNIVEVKQKEILDSITYAKRLQDAILPAANSWSKNLKDSFILYLPKDIVAGDFYWMEAVQSSKFNPDKYTGQSLTGSDSELQTSNSELILVAAGDCTGHGVPGAMVSVVCANALNRSVLEFGITDPGKILDKTREIVISTFEKSDKDVKDGMDISLVSLSPSTLTLHWSGANNPLWIVRNGELIEFSPDKQPIGKYAEQKPFTTHKTELHKGDTVYMFTDGYADQFGGERGKKFKYKQLSNLLMEICNKDVKEQKHILEKTFHDWKGNLEQVDDVLLIGLKI